MEDLFMQLARCPKKLGEKRDGGGLPALLRIPLRWVGSLGGSRGEKRGPEQEESSADLVRVRTWPPGLGRPSTDPELREARKWSRAIGKQIAADRFDAKWHMLSVLLFSPYCRCWTTDHETKVRLIDGLASQSTNMKLEAASKVHLPGVREAIRRNILREAERLIRSVSGTGTLGEEVSGLCSGAVSAIRALGSTLDEDMGRLLGDLWKTGRFQEGLREKSSGSGPGGQNDVLISAINRASAKDYAPTLADYRRFWVDHRFVPLVGTFKFDIDPVSIRIFDPQRLRDAEKTRKLSKEFWAESTSILVPIDLAQYEVCRGCWAEDGEPESGRLAEVASNLSSIAQYRQEGHPLSFIVVLMNVEGLRAKLDQIPFLSIYPDYKGRPDSPDDVVQYTIDRLCAACDTSDDKERMPIESYYHVGEPWEESTLKYILTALKASKTIQDLVGMGVVKMGKE
ncbi:hypothetical protein QBC39DRAFT_365029 [Podospora conica]|nr:hypothetical protein QBC39DRAFT_365029 [Schizothecium conicum]